MPLSKSALISKVNQYIYPNTTKDITALKMREILVDIINAFDGSYLIEGNLDLSFTSLYDSNTLQMSLSNSYLDKGKIILSCTEWLNTTTYNQYNVVKSLGTDGGVAGLCYRSKQNGNTGNQLNNSTWWEFADANGGNVGFIELLQINNFPTDHPTQFEVDGITVKFIATPQGSISPGKFVLDLNTDVILQGLGFLKLENSGAYLRKMDAGLLL